jgi:helicase
MGINTPAEAVIIAGLMHPQNEPYTVAEYKNMVGRAGRLGFSEEGFSFLLATTPHEEQAYWRDYVLAKPEDLTSRFLDAGTDIRSIIIRVLAALQRASKAGITAAEITDFLSASFGAHRARFANPNWKWSPAEIQLAIRELLGAGLLEGDIAGQVRLTPLGRFCGEAGVHVQSALRVIEAFRTIDPAKICDPTLLTLTQLTVELNEIYLPINTKSTDKEPNEWPRILRLQGVSGMALSHLQHQVDSTHDVTRRAKRAVVCLYWISGQPMADIEVAMTKFGGGTKDVAGAVRQVVSRTSDLLDVVGRIVGHVHPGVDFSKRLARLNVRLQVGVNSQMTEVARVIGGLIGRSEYMLLQQNELDAVEKIRAAKDDLLLKCFESDHAEKLITIRRLTAIQEEPEVVVPPLEPYKP